ncbi:hypothetical protein P3T76_004475 [Phytophthora citrophthora]|uniref:U2A'/phosphoprotein 32 family A C-terminal domain-containing protein n=1 Tax=Phytophthora citrophthora TaxID=4793 RepID=A0AAD9GUM8_9STRA|nr:hypothetical protein P3T76_004475 [Phytophthora citrophthora]
MDPFCPQLMSLNLVGNPVETVEHYRQIIANFVPQLVSLDGRGFSASERDKLSDVEIDTAIQKHQDQVPLSISASDSASNLREIEVSRPRQLSYSSSTASLNGFPVESPRNDDSGSSLTHGTDIVFAGNVSSALRRHRHEAEAGKTQEIQMFLAGTSETSTKIVRPPSSHGLPNRPKTPAQRISITDTLNRARELDTHKLKSREAILDELKTWQLDSVGTSQIGFPREPLYEKNNVSKRTSSRRKGSIDDVSNSEAVNAACRARLERRPNTSAGVLRNGINVREAFVESASDSTPRPRSRGGSSRRRSSTSGVDILILHGGDDNKPSCSPTKSSRGILTISSSKKALGHQHDWNLEVLSPIVDITTAKRHLPTSLTSKQQLERSMASRARESRNNGASSDSDLDDESNVCPAVASELGSPAVVPKTAFFNVAESLNALEKWRDEMEYDAEDTEILSVASLQQSCLSPREISTVAISEGKSANNFTTTSNQQSPPTRQQNRHVELGPANLENDSHLVQLLKERHSKLKTRDGFRSYFCGIEKDRLEGILDQTFQGQDKVRRRMQLMAGFFHHELQG